MMLARTLGYASPRRMLAEMAPSELGEWLADYAIAPWGEWRADFRHAQTTSLIANVNRDASKKPEAYTPKDFMFDHLMEEQETNKQAVLLNNKIRAAFMPFKIVKDK